MFLNSLNHFRALAILAIVAGHAHGIADLNHETFPGKVFHNLFGAGGAHFFVFISGFLFHHVFFRRFDWKSFLGNKVKNLLLPYCLLSLLPVVYFILSRDWEGGGRLSYFTPTGSDWFSLYAVPFVKYYLTGYRILGYWYIPFAILLFGISPIFIGFVRLRLRTQLLVLLPMLLVALFLHRPVHGTPWTVFQSLVYFSPVYCLGIMGSIYRRHLYVLLRNREYYLLAGAVILAVVQAGIGDIEGSSFKPALEYAGADLMLLQKLLFCFFLLVWLRKFEKRRWPVLGLLASYSFGIFFTHTLFMSAIVTLKERNGIVFSGGETIWLYPLGVLLLVLLSLAFTMTVRRVFPRHSRYLVGS